MYRSFCCRRCWKVNSSRSRKYNKTTHTYKHKNIKVRMRYKQCNVCALYVFRLLLLFSHYLLFPVIHCFYRSKGAVSVVTREATTNYNNSKGTCCQVTITYFMKQSILQSSMSETIQHYCRAIHTPVVFT